MFSPEERRRAVDLYSATPMTTAQVVEHLGYPTRQCPERWLAKDPRHAGHMARPIIPLETKDQGDRTGAGRHARKRAAERFGAGVGAVRNWVKAYREGGMAALRPKNGNASQTNKPAPQRSRNARTVGDDVEALRRRVEELELENAVMREVVEVVRKDPGAGLRRLSDREKTLPVDRLRPTYSLNSMVCLFGIAPSSHLLPPRRARG
ncbi:transposase [Bifidobacterium breve JCM 7019]|uniref:helix-turn-helix domain-containing protein n=1 Tax=Bifidobacterium breve TaxID=1685 RepID=UPI0003EFB9AD|nr:helix-turn-helix domain-containing protein [Bifidobacterium breve]AHJ18712.1 transposase [Bifidobacterium breve JCM 7019]